MSYIIPKGYTITSIENEARFIARFEGFSRKSRIRLSPLLTYSIPMSLDHVL